MSSEYQTIVGIATAKHVVKKSRFFGEASAINSQDAAKKFVVDVKARFRQATHHCYAYHLGNGDEKQEYATDAGNRSTRQVPLFLLRFAPPDFLTR